MGLIPRRVFVNSMSDLMHEQIGDTFRDLCFDVMEKHDVAVFQVLTKRAMTMRRYIERRYGGRPMPRHIWLGASVEDNKVRGRIDTMRALKEQHDAVTFLSIDPLLGLPDRHDYRGIDQVLIGGESGPKARPMDAGGHERVLQAAHTKSARVQPNNFMMPSLTGRGPLLRRSTSERASGCLRGQLVTNSRLTTLGKASKCDLNFAKRGVATMAAVPTANSRIISEINSALCSLKNLPIPRKCPSNA